MPVDIRVEGMSGARAQLAALGDRMRTAQGTTLEVLSSLPYAYGIETGYSPRGRLARRAGGAWMFRQGVEAGTRRLDARIGPAIASGASPSAVVGAYAQVGRDTVDEVRHRTPRRSGRLAGSVRMRLRGPGGRFQSQGGQA